MAHLDYDRILPRSVVEMPASGIRKFFDILDSMTDVTALTVGQPDFVTPWKIREAGIESLESGKTYYTSNSGTLVKHPVCELGHRSAGLAARQKCRDDQSGVVKYCLHANLPPCSSRHCASVIP